MCGFLAAFGPSIHAIKPRLVALGALLAHRGPNGTRIYQDEFSLIIFHRLAIQDLSPRSDQPMVDSTEQFVLAFNGELYNRVELIRSLASRCSFATSGDTEVLLNGLVLEGAEFLSRVHGMFSFVFWNRKERKILSARDPFGIKPLYFVQHRDSIVFASEPRPLRLLADDRVCPEDLAELLVFRHLSNQRSGFKKVRPLPPGVYLQGALSQLTTRVFADPLSLFERDSEMSEGMSSAYLERCLSQSVADHTISDVGYSVQLSGGVDSSLVSALCRTVTSRQLDSYGANIIDYENDEGAYRQEVATSYDLVHHEVPVTARGYADAFPEVVYALDAPSPHYGCVALYLVAKEIARSHRVVLTGEGADEMFGGYSRYLRVAQYLNANTIGSDAKRTTAHSVVLSCVYTDPQALYSIFPELNFSFEGRFALARRFPDTLRQMIALDTGCYLASLLLRQDRVSMAHGVEARVPFVHWPLAQQLARMPLAERMSSVTTKATLKKVALRYLSDGVVLREKNGLSLPIGTWIEDETSIGRFLPLLTDSSACLSEFADQRRLREFVTRPRKASSGRASEGSLLAQLINVELWLRSVKIDRSAPT
jgi:asparagine synthase (glutamine-hydrolysing)